MNVAVCDDQLDYLNLIQKKIIECFHEPEMELNVYTFSTIQDMLRMKSKHQSYVLLSLG